MADIFTDEAEDFAEDALFQMLIRNLQTSLTQFRNT